MSDDQGKELSPAFAGSSLEETVPVPAEVEAAVAVPPQNPPSDLAQVGGLDDVEVWPAVEPDESECCFMDYSEIGFSVEVAETENESNSERESESQNENESEIGASAALDVQASQAGAQSWPEEEELHGFLHLYKATRKATTKERVMHRSMLGILNIPAMMTRDNLRSFLAPFQEVIDEVKIIKDATLSQYMALIKFVAEDIADNFYMVYNGCSFNEKDSEACQLVYVGRFEALKSDRASFPMKNLIELPRCTVCLERTGDSMQSILTWLCDQSFEDESYQNPTSMMCPVCSYFHMPEQEEARCFECGVTGSLHICLICGYFGCGRAVLGHADKHFDETKHAYVMQVNDHKVWDYIENNYVQSETCHSSSYMGQYEKDTNEEKITALQLEYSYSLSKRLESQQIFWEQKIMQIEREYHEEINNMKAKLSLIIERCSKQECEINDLLKQKQAAEEKCTLLNAQVSELFTELKEEQEKNKNLIANQIVLENQHKEEEKVLKDAYQHIEVQITQIREQVQDTIFYLEAQHEVSDPSAETGQESQEGQSSIAMAASASPPQEEEM
ncbi:BRCA1-associated protein-like [Trichosurus vulpecula]|uniref:BRCA1-associated protein-like n=1 Tax=Trichosurus vulpecula TaxID=9337 RepID=UPI00186B268C|nr:BRCA1-associated protein-like [Trichosurus vulpecula]